jgi:hypothetical protein
MWTAPAERSGDGAFQMETDAGTFLRARRKKRCRSALLPLHLGSTPRRPARPIASIARWEHREETELAIILVTSWVQALSDESALRYGSGIPKGLNHSAKVATLRPYLGTRSRKSSSTLKALHQSQIYRSSKAISYRRCAVRIHSFLAPPPGCRIFHRGPGVSLRSTPGYCLSTLQVDAAEQPEGLPDSSRRSEQRGDLRNASPQWNAPRRVCQRSNQEEVKWVIG